MAYDIVYVVVKMFSLLSRVASRGVQHMALIRRTRKTYICNVHVLNNKIYVWNFFFFIVKKFKREIL